MSDKLAAAIHPDLIDRAILEDVARRNRIAVALSVVVAIIIVLVHEARNDYPLTLKWISAIVLMQGVRMFIATSYLNAGSSRPFSHWRLAFMVAVGAAGVGWGLSLYVFEDGKADILFLFRFMALASILGTAMNSLSQCFRIYAAFLLGMTSVMLVYISGTPTLPSPADRMFMSMGTLLYLTFLLIVGASWRSQSRQFFRDRFEREEAHRMLMTAHAKEQELHGRLEAETRKLAETNRQLEELASRDSLTGIFNRRRLMEQLEREMGVAARHEAEFSVLMVDVDHFKRINDSHGHQTGDTVLRGVARVLGEGLRDIDMLGRTGGEEFLCLLPMTTGEAARACADRLRAALEAATLLPEKPYLRVTASFGIASYQDGDTPESLVARADARLYEAKAAGRNRVAG